MASAALSLNQLSLNQRNGMIFGVADAFHFLSGLASDPSRADTLNAMLLS
jgi:hypothetical protein